MEQAEWKTGKYVFANAAKQKKRMNHGHRTPVLLLSLVSPETQEVIKVMQDRVHGSMFHISGPAKCP
jgi:hypothetical protein